MKEKFRKDSNSKCESQKTTIPISFAIDHVVDICMMTKWNVNSLAFGNILVIF